ncbi:hypothetical protein FXW27_00720 [Candidatus Liberibacter asiaticus]|nr:hypothetical protein FXW32_00665 [Candidatus Liberibacter asiaticus]KAE9516873.1 hypothetical protein FXW27_00720 [Candidatus Liberibacter asiaticus]
MLCLAISVRRRKVDPVIVILLEIMGFRLISVAILPPKKEIIINLPSLERRVRCWFKYSAPTISNMISIPLP